MISTCPKCEKQVSIPPDADSAALVRCPLCEAEYALSESLALVPPALIIVASEEMLAAAPDMSWGPSEAGEEEEGERSKDENNEAASAAERFAGLPASAPLRTKKQKSGLQVLIEIVAGGLAGCLVAYYALAFYFGPQFPRVGLPKLPLPFISWITAPPDKVDKGNGEESKPSAERLHGRNVGRVATRPSVNIGRRRPIRVIHRDTPARSASEDTLTASLACASG